MIDYLVMISMILIVLSVILSVLLAFKIGFDMGSKTSIAYKTDKNNKANKDTPAKPTNPLTEEQLKDLRKKQIELQNFYNYSGYEMPKPEDIL